MLGNDVSSLGYILASLEFSQKQQRGIVALLIRTACFSDNYDGFVWDENSSRQKKQEADIQTVKKVLNEHSAIFKPWQAIKNPSEQEIVTILNHALPMNDKALLQFLVTLTQLRLLGRYSEQGLHNHSEIQQYQAVKKQEDEDIIRSLELDQEAVWPEESNNITHVFLHAATEVALRARLNHLFTNLQQHGEEKVYIYYATNPRGVFPFESSLAEILADRILLSTPHLSAISFPKIVEVIKAALKLLIDKKIDWTKPNGISQSVQLILQNLQEAFNGEILWPSVQEGDYDSIYNECARLEGREEFLQYWPTGIELLQHLIHTFAKDYELEATRFIVVPHLVSGTINAEGKYCPATTAVLLKDFVQKYGEKLAPEMIAVVTDNSVTFSAQRQDLETRQAFAGKLEYALLHDALDIKKFSVLQAYQQMAKLLFALNAMDPFGTETTITLKKEKPQDLMAAPQSESSATTQRSLSPVSESSSASSNRYVAFPKPRNSDNKKLQDMQLRIDELTQELKILEEQEADGMQPSDNRDPREYFCRNEGEVFYEKIRAVRRELKALRHEHAALRSSISSLADERTRPDVDPTVPKNSIRSEAAYLQAEKKEPKRSLSPTNG